MNNDNNINNNASSNENTTGSAPISSSLSTTTTESLIGMTTPAKTATNLSKKNHRQLDDNYEVSRNGKDGYKNENNNDDDDDEDYDDDDDDDDDDDNGDHKKKNPQQRQQSEEGEGKQQQQQQTISKVRRGVENPTTSRTTTVPNHNTSTIPNHSGNTIIGRRRLSHRPSLVRGLASSKSSSTIAMMTSTTPHLHRRSSPIISENEGIISGVDGGDVGSDGIHAAFIFLATSKNVPMWKKIAAFFASWLIVIWQLILYAMIVGESTKPYCTVDDDCREGQTCHADSFCGAPQSTSIAAGSTNTTNTTSNNNDDNRLDILPDKTMNAALNEDCPFLDKCTSWGTRLAVIFTLIFIVGSIIDDMDQNSRILRAGTFRLQKEKEEDEEKQKQKQKQKEANQQRHQRNHQTNTTEQNISGNPPSESSSSSTTSCCKIDNSRHAFVSFNIWALYYVRAYLLPYTAFGATIAIIYAEDSNITAQTVILNGLAVSFIGSFDDALFGLLLPPALQDKAATAMTLATYAYYDDYAPQQQQQQQQQTPDNPTTIQRQQRLLQQQRQDQRIWIFHRIMCFAYAGLSCWIIFYPIQAIKHSPSFFFLTSTSYKQEYASCDDFYVGISSWPTLLLLVSSSLDKVVLQAPRSIMIRDFFLGPIFLIIFWTLVFLTMLSIYTAVPCD